MDRLTSASIRKIFSTASSKHPDSPVFHRFFQPAFDALSGSGSRRLCHRIPDEDAHSAGIPRCASDSRTDHDFL